MLTAVDRASIVATIFTACSVAAAVALLPRLHEPDGVGVVRDDGAVHNAVALRLLPAPAVGGGRRGRLPCLVQPPAVLAEVFVYVCLRACLLCFRQSGLFLAPQKCFGALITILLCPCSPCGLLRDATLLRKSPTCTEAFTLFPLGYTHRQSQKLVH